MGYDINRFVNLSSEIADNFKCSVCLDIFEAPLELPCGHIFCLECIRSCFNNTNTCDCPECRQRVESREVKPPNRKLLCLLHSLNIKCAFADGTASGCHMIVKLENLIAHTRECPFNTTARPSGPLAEPNFENYDNITHLLSGDSDTIDRLERLQQFHVMLAAFSQMMHENELENYSSDDDRSQEITNENDNELLIGDETSYVICFLACALALVPLVLLIAMSVTAIVISSMKLHYCTQMPTLPRALLALGISLLLSVILETIRMLYYKEKFCAGLKLIQCCAFGSLTYLAIVVYSNLDYKIQTVHDSISNSTLTCDDTLFEFSLSFVSSLLALICVAIISSILRMIFKNLTTIWTEWERSYVLLIFIYIIPLAGIVISISAMAMGSVYFVSCPDIPWLTTELVIFGTFGFVCWLFMLLNHKFTNSLYFAPLVICSFICVAVSVHENFPWQVNSHALIFSINCNKTIYIYSFVIVCVNYTIIGSIIFMYTIYGGICRCLFFT